MARLQKSVEWTLFLLGVFYCSYVALNFMGVGLVGLGKDDSYVAFVCRWAILTFAVGGITGTFNSPGSHLRLRMLVPAWPLLAVSVLFLFGAIESRKLIGLVGVLAPILVAGAFVGGFWAGLLFRKRVRPFPPAASS